MEDGFECVAALTVIAADHGVGGWSGWVWAACSFCMSVSFHNSSAKRDCQASLWFWRSIRSCLQAITTERWGSYFQIPAGQLASTLFWTRRDNKTISLNQEHLPPSLQPLPLPLPSSEIRCGIKVTLADITFPFFPFTFCLPNETFLLLQRERFVICYLAAQMWTDSCRLHFDPWACGDGLSV